MDISILLPTKNAGARFIEVLKQIHDQDIDASYELVQVDSGSTDQTLGLAANYPIRLYQIAPADFGHGRTRNYLTSLARGRILVCLSQDAIPAERTWLAKLVAPLADPAVAASFGRQVPEAGAALTQVYFLQHWYPSTAARLAIGTPAETRIESLFYSNVNAAFKKEVWEKIRFDEQLIMSEDQEWSRQVLLAGYQIVYEPEAAVIHSHSYTLRTAFKRNFDSGASLVRITSDKMGAWLKHGLAYVWGELRFLARAGHATEVPYACIYETTRFVGFFLGYHHARIPLGLKKRMSQHSYYWQQPR